MFVALKQNYLKSIYLSLFLLLSHLVSAAQEPSVQFAVVTLQDISFGAFFQGNAGGSIIISSDGTRLLTGDIVEANISGFSYFPAIFEVEADPGMLISILKGSDTSMFGSNGGSLGLQVGDSDASFPIIAPPLGRIQISMGGILTVGNPQANPSGDYSGSFEVTFIQE